MWNIKTEGKGERVRGKGVAAARHFALRLLFALTLCPLPFALSGCRMDMQDQPRYEAYEAGDVKYFKDGKASRQLIEGTVPRVAPGQPYVDVQNDYLYTGRSVAAGSAAQGAQGGGTQGAPAVRANVPTAGGAAATQATGQEGPDVFPMMIDEAAVRRGQERYNIYCAMCHGMTGEGDGMIWRRGFRKPPSFYEDRLQSPTSSASHFFDVITNGWGAMPSYSDMIPAEDRWKIIAYVRALQLSGKGKLEDVPEDKRKALESGQPTTTRGATQGEGGEGQSGQGDKNH